LGCSPCGEQVAVAVTASNNDQYCAPVTTWASLVPAANTVAAFSCNLITVVVVPDINKLEISYVTPTLYPRVPNLPAAE
jgi:hypothetical protein